MVSNLFVVLVDLIEDILMAVKYKLITLIVMFSGPCYKRQMQPLSKTTRTPFVRKPHSIRLVEIPPTSNSGRGIKLSVESASRNSSATQSYCPGLRISEYVLIPFRFIFTCTLIMQLMVEHKITVILYNFHYSVYLYSIECVDYLCVHQQKEV